MIPRLMLTSESYVCYAFHRKNSSLLSLFIIPIWLIRNVIIFSSSLSLEFTFLFGWFETMFASYEKQRSKVYIPLWLIRNCFTLAIHAVASKFISLFGWFETRCLRSSRGIRNVFISLFGWFETRVFPVRTATTLHVYIPLWLIRNYTLLQKNVNI